METGGDYKSINYDEFGSKLRAVSKKQQQIKACIEFGH